MHARDHDHVGRRWVRVLVLVVLLLGVGLFAVRHNITRPAPVVTVHVTPDAKADSLAIGVAVEAKCHKPHDFWAKVLGIDAPSDVRVRRVFPDGLVRTLSLQCFY